jgi:dTDP-4-amino-4,6-dideoxygalactose transaminase
VEGVGVMARRLMRLSKSVIGEGEKQAVLRVMDREYLGMGMEVEEFENLLTSFFGRPTVCVNSGTAALHLALQGVGLGKGDEVLVQSITYLSSFQAISATGAKPIPCEVDPVTVTLDVKDVEKRLTNKTKVVMPVYYAGGIGKLDEIYTFAESNGLRVVEDAAHTFGSLYKGKKVGSFGDIACFSFDGIKNITSGEGGAIVTNDRKVLQKVRDARLLGVEKDTKKRFAGQRSWDFDVRYQGWRYHMSNIMAAIGIEQLKRFPEFAAKRQKLAKRYQENLSNTDSIELLEQDFDFIVPHIFVIKLRLGDRDDVRKNMLKKGIETGFHYQPNHFLTLYNLDESCALPITEQIFPTLLTLPLHPDLEELDVDYICSHLLGILSQD